MIFFAQIDPSSQKVIQGLAFSTPEFAQSHMEANQGSFYVSTLEFVSPTTHQYIDGHVVPMTI